MKLLLSLAATLLFSVSALASDLQGHNIEFFPGTATAQIDQYYSFNFGATPVRMSRYVDFNLSNRGPGHLGIQQVATTGADFHAYHNCPMYLPPHTYCTLRIGFTPWFEGFKAGRLYAYTSEGRIIINLNGWAVR